MSLLSSALSIHSSLSLYVSPNWVTMLRGIVVLSDSFLLVALLMLVILPIVFTSLQVTSEHSRYL